MLFSVGTKSRWRQSTNMKNCLRLALDSVSWEINRTTHDDPSTSCAVDVSQRCAGIPTKPTQSW
jgi:hypothetical protein